MTVSASKLRAELRSLANPDIAQHSQCFFKTGPGGYAEGDRFIGVRVPVLRGLAKRYALLEDPVLLSLLHSPIHEERLFALLSMVDRFRDANHARRAQICNLYMDNLDYVNNWDLVDCSAPHIVGPWFRERSKRRLYKLVREGNLWRRRVAVLAGFDWIKQHDFEHTLVMAELLLDDHEDLIHKAVGWMLREIGKRDLVLEEQFLLRHYAEMPRTMLRYAIEKFPENRRQAYLQGTVQ